MTKHVDFFSRRWLRRCSLGCRVRSAMICSLDLAAIRLTWLFSCGRGKRDGGLHRTARGAGTRDCRQ